MMTLAEDRKCLKHNCMCLEGWGKLYSQRQMTINIMGMKSN